MQFNRPPPPAQLVCVCLSLCVVHAQCCRTGPAGIEQIRSLVSVSRLLLVAFPSPSPIGGERSDVSTLYSYVV